jgi:site-specific DNA recombinase
MNNPRRACAYIRVSKEREEGISPEQQKEKAELQAKILGLDLLHIYPDIDLSGRSDQRPHFQEMVRDIKAGMYDVCLVYKLDRFCRNVSDFHYYIEILESHGCSLISISQNIDTSTPMGRLLRNILADFAQFESEMIGERVKDNKLAAARKGRWNGGRVPYGYIFADRQFSINEEEAPAVRIAYRLRGKGWGFLKIAKELTAHGYKPRNGTKRGLYWSEDSVRYIIENPIYKGILEYENVSIEGAIPAIVGRDEWEASQVMGKMPSQTQHSPHLLSGLLYCTSCNHAGWTIVKNGRVYVDREGHKHDRVIRYMCRTKRDKNAAACKCKLLDKTTLEERILETVFSVADDKDRIEEFTRAEIAASKETGPNPEQLKSELEDLRRTMTELFSDYYDHKIITRDQFTEKNKEYLKREAVLTEKLEEIEVQPKLRQEALDSLFTEIRSMQTFWGDITPEEKKLALRQVIRRIDVYPDHVEVDFFGIIKAIAPKLSSGATLFF